MGKHFQVSRLKIGSPHILFCCGPPKHLSRPCGRARMGGAWEREREVERERFLLRQIVGMLQRRSCVCPWLKRGNNAFWIENISGRITRQTTRGWHTRSPPKEIKTRCYFVNYIRFFTKMANDSPAKSLGDIDLASLRVSVPHTALFYAFYCLSMLINYRKILLCVLLLLTEPCVDFLCLISAGLGGQRTGRCRLLHRTNPTRNASVDQ